MVERIRQPAVAGQFYPRRPDELIEMVNGYIKEAADIAGPVPKAIIAPHAGYIYSGPVAGSAYARLAQANGAVKRVVLLGPSHLANIRGLATSNADSFATPLGRIPLDKDGLLEALAFRQVEISDQAHSREHSLEVQLPFLQIIFSDFKLVPLVVGSPPEADVAEVLAALWGGPETVVVISSDLSHYQSYSEAVALDKITSENIESLRPVTEGQACGRRAINGLLHLAREAKLQGRTVDLRNSGDTAGPRDRVVGYGAYIFWSPD
jgi:AmmeMemoRadiSam system protein B